MDWFLLGISSNTWNKAAQESVQSALLDMQTLTRQATNSVIV